MANRTVLGVMVGLTSVALAATASGALPSDSYSRLYGATLSVTLQASGNEKGSAAEKVDTKEISGGKLQREAGSTFSMEDVVVKVPVAADGAAGAGKGVREISFANRFRTDLSATTLAIAIEPAKAVRSAGPNVVFKIVKDQAVRDWFKKGGARTITVSLLSATGVFRDYLLGGCEPVSLSVMMLPGLGSNAGVVEVDTLTVKSTSLQIKSSAVMARWFNSGGRASAAVGLLNRDGSTARTYSFPDAVLTKFEVTPLDSNVVDVQAIETYTFKVEKPSVFF